MKKAWEAECEKDPIVVTGMGLVTPLGIGLENVWNRLINNESGIRALDDIRDKVLFDPISVHRFKCQVAGVVPGDLDSQNQPTSAIESLAASYGIGKKDLNKMDRFIVWSLIATDIALKDACWLPASEDQQIQTGVVIGSGIGGLKSIQDSAIQLYTKGPQSVSPFFIPSALTNLAAGHVSIKHKFYGPILSTVTACASGIHSIGEAYKALLTGQAEVMVAGGAEAALCPLGIEGFDQMRALCKDYNHDPVKASRPFDKKRSGFVMGEGAGILVLERKSHAERRKAPHIYGEIVGYGLSADGHHIAAPREDGLSILRCMELALREAFIKKNPKEALNTLGSFYFNVHGTSTPLGDIVELRAIETLVEFFSKDSSPVFSWLQSFPKDWLAAYRNFYRPLFQNQTFASSTKSAIGHLLGAAGAVESIFCLLALSKKILPPTLNLEDPEETFLDLLPCFSREVPDLAMAMCTSFGFGGFDAALVFRPYHPSKNSNGGAS